MADEHDLQQALSDQIASLSQKHVNVSYLLIGVLALVLGLAGAGGIVAYKMFNSALAKAEQQEARYDADRKAMADQLAAHDAERDATEKQQKVIIQVVHDKDTEADKTIKDVTAPDKTAVQAADDVDKAYGILAVPLDGSHIQFTVPQVQQFTATKVDRDRLSFDLGQTTSLFKLEQQKTSSLTADLGKCKDTVVEGQKTIDGYKSVVAPSRWKKIIHGLEIGGAIAGAVLLGRGMH